MSVRIPPLSPQLFLTLHKGRLLWGPADGEDGQPGHNLGKGQRGDFKVLLELCYGPLLCDSVSML